MSKQTVTEGEFNFPSSKSEMDSKKSLLIPMQTLVKFGKTKVRLYVPAKPMTYDEIVVEAKRLGIYKTYNLRHAYKLIDKLWLIPEINKQGGPVHYTLTPIKLGNPELYCLETYHPIDDGGKPPSDDSSKERMYTEYVWGDNDGVAFLFKDNSQSLEIGM